MGAPIPMPTETADILTLAQWLSPAYPVGAFAYSHGLEAAIAAGQTTSAESLYPWVSSILENGSGRTDALFLAAAYNCDNLDRLAEIDATCRAFAPSRERLAETELQGTAFAQVTAAVWGIDLPVLCYPVAVGRAARMQGLPLEASAALYLQAFASNLISAGIRLIPLGQTEGQDLVCRLAGLCQSIASETLDGELARLSGTAFLADIASMQHETLTTRIFRT